MGFREWHAICPKCAEKLTHADYTCTNCTKGRIKIYRYQDSDGVHREVFTCENCRQRTSQLKCPKCETIIDGVAQRAGCFIASAAFGYESVITRALRIFRDTVLIRLPGGRSFVFWYYKRSQAWLEAHRK